MANGSDALVGCQVRFGDDLLVGMPLVDALQARLILSAAGFRGIEQAPCFTPNGRALPGQFKLEYPDPALPGLMIPVYSLAEARQMARYSYYLPIAPARRVADFPECQAARRGQLNFLGQLGFRVR